MCNHGYAKLIFWIYIQHLQANLSLDAILKKLLKKDKRTCVLSSPPWISTGEVQFVILDIPFDSIRFLFCVNPPTTQGSFILYTEDALKHKIRLFELVCLNTFERTHSFWNHISSCGHANTPSQVKEIIQSAAHRSTERCWQSNWCWGQTSTHL